MAAAELFSHGISEVVKSMVRRIASLKSVPYEIGHRVNYTIFITLGAIQDFTLHFSAIDHRKCQTK